MAVQGPEAIDAAPLAAAAQRRTATGEVSWSARNAGSGSSRGVPRGVVRQGKKVRPQPLRLRRSRRSRPSARPSHQETVWFASRAPGRVTVAGMQRKDAARCCGRNGAFRCAKDVPIGPEDPQSGIGAATPFAGKSRSARAGRISRSSPTYLDTRRRSDSRAQSPPWSGRSDEDNIVPETRPPCNGDDPADAPIGTCGVFASRANETKPATAAPMIEKASCQPSDGIRCITMPLVT